MAVFLARVLLICALIGLSSGTAFLILVAVSAIRFRRKQPPEIVTKRDLLPRAALLKPLCGLEPNLEANLESFFQQDYPRFEIIFGMRSPKDPALDVVERLQKRYPEVLVKTVFSGDPDRPNAKVCSLKKMYAACTSDYIVMSDSDVHVTRNYLQEVVSPLLDPEVGLVTCLYRGVPTGGSWSALEALGMSVEMTSGVLVAELLEGMRFALGPTMAIRRDILDAVGGFAALEDYCADDYVLGNAVHESGRKVLLSKYILDHVAINRSFRRSIAHQVRWMKSTRFSRPKGHIGTGLTFAMPFGLLGLLAGLGAGHPWVALAMLAWALFNRAAMSVLAGWLAVRDPRALRYCWLYSLRDVMGFCFWCASFVGNTVIWRGEKYRLCYGGKMRRVGIATEDQSSLETIAVDHLA